MAGAEQRVGPLEHGHSSHRNVRVIPTSRSKPITAIRIMTT
jgi:hypothetical protein